MGLTETKMTKNNTFNNGWTSGGAS